MARSSAGRSPQARPLLARLALGRLARPLAAAAPSAAGRLQPGRATAPRGRGGSPPAAAMLPARFARRWLALLSAHRRLRLWLLAGLLAVALLTGGWLWLRHSSLVSVQRVRVSGVHGPEAHAIEAALQAAGRRMSTLDVRVGALRAAVASFPVVRDVRASASFPHGLSIHVTEQPPVAALVAAGTKTAVAANGVALGPALLTGSLPTVTAGSAPATGGRVSDAGMLAAVAVLGAAPAPFAKAVARVYTGPNGLTVAMRNGLLAYFGDASRPHAKWLSLARVLADSSSTGASYIDVRVPERPAAGFPGGVRPAGTGTSPETSPETAGGMSGAGSEATIAALAARLAGPAGNETTPSEKGTSHGSEPEAHGSPAPIEGGSGASSETARSPERESASGGATPTGKGP